MLALELSNKQAALFTIETGIKKTEIMETNESLAQLRWATIRKANVKQVNSMLSNSIILPVSGLEPEPHMGQGFKPCTSTNFVIQALEVG